MSPNPTTKAEATPSATPARRTTTPAPVTEHEALADLDLQVVSLIAKTIGQERGDATAAYEVALRAIIPEGLTPHILAAAREHKLKVRILVEVGVKA
jgi:hypothetical protein